jgi:hypothetical protein
MSNLLPQFRRRLIELGCPPVQLRGIVREVADHQDDLFRAALAAGLSPADAQVRADAELGDPLTLAERHIAVLRQSSWWARHPVLGFGLVPFLAAPFLWLLWLGLGTECLCLLLYGGDYVAFGHAGNNPLYFPRFALALEIFGQLGFVAVALLFCWLGRRWALGSKWTFVACGLVALHAFCLWARVIPHNFSIGYGTSIYFWRLPLSSFVNAAIPLLLATLFHLSRRRALTRAATEPIANSG